MPLGPCNPITERRSTEACLPVTIAACALLRAEEAVHRLSRRCAAAKLDKKAINSAWYRLKLSIFVINSNFSTPFSPKCS